MSFRISVRSSPGNDRTEVQWARTVSSLHEFKPESVTSSWAQFFDGGGEVAGAGRGVSVVASASPRTEHAARAAVRSAKRRRGERCG